MANISGLNDSIKTSLKNDFAAANHGTHLTIGTGASNAAAGNHTHTNILNQDTRAVNTTPNDVPIGLSVHLKSNGTDSLSDGGTYHSSLFIKGWNDYSGGPYGNLAITANNNLWFRASSSGTDWNSWKKVSLDGHTHSNYATTATTGSLSSLQTNAKGSLVAAINEVFQSGNSVKKKLVDALIAKGAIGISINDSWDTIINSIGDFKQQVHPDPTKRNSYTFSIATGDNIVLQPDLRGDPDESGAIETDWGDGVVDTKTSHTYNNAGMFTVQTKWSIVDSEGNYDSATASALREVSGLNSLMDNLSYMFKDCVTLTSFADFEFRTLATTMSHMFENCNMLTTLNLNQWDTSNVKDMTYLFHNCSSLATLNADSWNLSSLLFADFIFSGCSSLV